jgi:Ice-binding-like/PEP-CTERM motif
MSPASPVNGTNAATAGNPFVHAGDVVSGLAQSELATAKTELGSLGTGTLLPANLAGLTLAPGVYTVPAGTSNLTGTLTLNGKGNLISIGCTNLLGGSAGSGGSGSGLGGGLTVPPGGGAPTPLPPLSTPEPGTMLLLGSGLATFLCMIRMKR